MFRQQGRHVEIASRLAARTVQADLGALEQAIRKFVAEVKTFVLAHFPDMRAHPQLGRWLQSNQALLPEEDQDRLRRGKRTVRLCTADVLLDTRPIAPEAPVLSGSPVRLDFEVDRRVLDEDRGDPPEQANWLALTGEYFEMPTCLSMGSDDLFWCTGSTNVQPHGGAASAAAVGHARVPWIHLPLIFVAEFGLEALKTAHRDATSHRAVDTTFGRGPLLRLRVIEEDLLIKSCITGRTYRAPYHEVEREWTRFDQRARDLLRTEFPGLIDHPFMPWFRTNEEDT